jgi:hypothetical protein
MRQIKDHAPSQYEQHRDAILLVSGPEVDDIGHHPWIREATPAEVEAERVRLTTPWISAITGEPVPGRPDFNELHTYDGEPYMWVVVGRDAPGHIWRQATGHLRLRRFSDDG